YPDTGEDQYEGAPNGPHDRNKHNHLQHKRGSQIPAGPLGESRSRSRGALRLSIIAPVAPTRRDKCHRAGNKGPKGTTGEGGVPLVPDFPFPCSLVPSVPAF